MPHSLKGDALVKAGLTPETWRLEIVGDGKAAVTRPRTVTAGSALDLNTVLELGKTRGVRFMKAMQCNNIDRPLGQGLWEGVPLRDVLRLAGKIDNARRLFYWGFHNNDPKQMFRSSLAMNHASWTASAGRVCPCFIAYKLNGAMSIPLKRGGSCAHAGALGRIGSLVYQAYGCNMTFRDRADCRANDTYAEYRTTTPNRPCEDRGLLSTISKPRTFHQRQDRSPSTDRAWSAGLD